MVAAGDEIRVLVDAVGGDGAAVEAAFDGGVLRRVAGAVAAPATGDHWLAVASRDRAGNLSPVRWILVRVDGEPPAIELRTIPSPVADDGGRRWLPAGAEVVASASDGLAGVAGVSLEVAGERRAAAAERLAAPLPDDGQVRVRGWASDRVDNQSQAAVLDLWIDPLPPEVEIRVEGPRLGGAGGGLEGAVLAPSSRLRAELADGGSGVGGWTPEVDGEAAAAAAWDGPWGLGRHTAGGTAIDRVGNSSRIGPIAFVVDGEGPEISWRVVSDGVVNDRGESYYWTPVEITASASDQPAGVDELRASVDGASWQLLGDPLAVDGDRLRLRAIDRLGNVTEVEARWGIDDQPPRIEVVPPAGEPVAAGGRLTVTRGEVIGIRVIDDGSGFDHGFYSYHLGWPLPDLRPLPTTLRCRRTGRFKLHVRAVDRIGNEARGDWVVKVRRHASPPGGETR